MSQYTELLRTEAETLMPEDDDYEERLLEVAESFRGFDEALTEFIKKHGYSGDSADVSAKTKFISERFKEANIKQPRNIERWFVPVKDLARKTAFQLCFAFSLNIDETNDFFRRVRFERSFDCHTVNETVYYFCIKNDLTYSDAQEIIEQIHDPGSIKTIPDHDVLYTTTILEYINSIDDKRELIRYINNNISDFRYNNATAIKYIQDLWSVISGVDGIAAKEAALIDKNNRYKDKSKRFDTDTRDGDVVKKEVREQTQTIKPEDYVIADSNASTWILLSQILGLQNYQKDMYKDNRSLTSVLSGSKLMPLRAAYCFPSRQSIDKVIRGDLVGDYEIIRKILIMLVFYSYWAKFEIKNNNLYCAAEKTDFERCIYNINNYLSSAGYPEMYEGNPYDWIYMRASYDKYPLDTFRYYMGEVFAIDSEGEVTDD